MRTEIYRPGMSVMSVWLGILIVASAAHDQTLAITRGAERDVREAPASNFTGVARVDMLFDALVNADATAGSVAFEAGARTAWHVHPGGQTLIVTAGVGRVQRWGDAAEEIRTGDVVRIPPGQKHWHGAAPESTMTRMPMA